MGICYCPWIDFQRYDDFLNLGKVANSQIKANLDAGHVVICNVHSGAHWVLATGYSGDTIYVNDPGFTTTSYTLGTIVDGQNAVYGVWSDYVWIWRIEYKI